jgi:hypothetical protein
MRIIIRSSRQSQFKHFVVLVQIPNARGIYLKESRHVPTRAAEPLFAMAYSTRDLLNCQMQITNQPGWGGLGHDTPLLRPRGSGRQTAPATGGADRHERRDLALYYDNNANLWLALHDRWRARITGQPVDYERVSAQEFRGAGRARCLARATR